MQPKPVHSYAMFSLGVILLAACGLAVYADRSYATNIIFLTILSLACSIIVAFLPGVARLEIPGWFSATGAIAVFVLVFWKMHDFALAEANRNVEQIKEGNVQMQIQIDELENQNDDLRDHLDKIKAGRDDERLRYNEVLERSTSDYWIRRETTSGSIKPGGFKSVVLSCPSEHRILGLDPNDTFPTGLDVRERKENLWTIELWNRHGPHRPLGTYTIAYYCLRNA